MSVTEPPFGPLEVLQAAGQPLGAHEPGHRRVDVLEQRVQRAHRHRVGAGDRGRPERRVLQVGAHVAADLGPHRLARGGPAGRHGSARPPRAAARARRWPPRPRRPARAMAARARARSCSGRAAARGRCRRAAAAPAARPAAGRPRARARAGTAACACGTARRSRRRSAAGRPTAPRRPAAGPARATPSRTGLDALADELEAEDVLVLRSRASSPPRPRWPRNGEAAQSTSIRSPIGRRVTAPRKSVGVRSVACTSNARWVAARISAPRVEPALQVAAGDSPPLRLADGRP